MKEKTVKPKSEKLTKVKKTIKKPKAVVDEVSTGLVNFIAHPDEVVRASEVDPNTPVIRVDDVKTYGKKHKVSTISDKTKVVTKKPVDKKMVKKTIEHVNNLTPKQYETELSNVINPFKTNAEKVDNEDIEMSDVSA